MSNSSLPNDASAVATDASAELNSLTAELMEVAAEAGIISTPCPVQPALKHASATMTATSTFPASPAAFDATQHANTDPVATSRDVDPGYSDEQVKEFALRLDRKRRAQRMPYWFNSNGHFLAARAYEAFNAVNEHGDLLWSKVEAERCLPKHQSYERMKRANPAVSATRAGEDHPQNSPPPRARLQNLPGQPQLDVQSGAHSVPGSHPKEKRQVRGATHKSAISSTNDVEQQVSLPHQGMMPHRAEMEQLGHLKRKYSALEQSYNDEQLARIDDSLANLNRLRTMMIHVQGQAQKIEKLEAAARANERDA